MEADHVEEQLLLIPVVVIEVGLGESAGFRDLVHGSAVVAMGGEQLGRAVEDRPSLLIVVAGASSSHEASLFLRSAIDDALGLAERSLDSVRVENADARRE